jgi:hypothetical protein
MKQVGDGAGVEAKCSDSELSRAGLPSNRGAVDLDNNRSVSEQLQRRCEVANIWCTNILADHPPGPACADQGKEISGEIGGRRRL